MLNPDLNQPSATPTLASAPAASSPVRIRSDAALAVMVVFATRNRATSLVQVMECFTRLVVPADGWKMVIVDNGSTDETPMLLRA